MCCNLQCIAWIDFAHLFIIYYYILLLSDCQFALYVWLNATRSRQHAQTNGIQTWTDGLGWCCKDNAAFKKKNLITICFRNNLAIVSIWSWNLRWHFYPCQSYLIGNQHHPTRRKLLQTHFLSWENNRLANDIVLQIHSREVSLDRELF